jgi:hypothetical protein
LSERAGKYGKRQGESGKTHKVRASDSQEGTSIHGSMFGWSSANSKKHIFCRFS